MTTAKVFLMLTVGLVLTAAALESALARDKSGTKGSPADAAWCQSAGAKLEARDMDTCVFRMERALNQRERDSIRDAFEVAISEKADRPSFSDGALLRSGGGQSTRGQQQ